MNYKIFFSMHKIKGIGIKTLLVCMLVSFVLFVGCMKFKKALFEEPSTAPTESISSTESVNSTDSMNSTASDSKKAITAINIVGDEVHIQANQPLTYSSVKHLVPFLNLVLYFSDTLIKGANEIQSSESNIIKNIRLESKDNSSKIEIALKQDTTYKVLREGNDLKVVFDTPKQEIQPDMVNNIEPVEPAQTDNGILQIKSVDTAFIDDLFKINVQADSSITEYKSSYIENPPKILLDLMNATSQDRTKKVIVTNNPYIKEIRMYSYPNRVRMVMDTEKAYLANLMALPASDGIVIQVGKTLPKVATQETTVQAKPIQAKPIQAKSSEPKQIIEQDIPPVESLQDQQKTEQDIPKKDDSTQSKPTNEVLSHSASKSGKASRIASIDFITEDDGASNVVVETANQVGYEFLQTNEKQFTLKLLNTFIPEHHRRVLPTQYFDTSVDKITPVQMDHKTVGIVMDLKEVVGYHIEQENNKIKVHYERSDAPIKPKLAGLEEIKGNFSQSMPQSSETVISKPIQSELRQQASSSSSPDLSETPPMIENIGTGLQGKKYVGEKIALDFYETDIKNVFRIIREVSGQNFAIDKAVVGKVTLTIKKPVPWDQILDLILKMNDLGMTREGDIIRVSTLSTIQREQKELLAQIESDKKSKEILEPVMTEYIPINYAKASDIKKHLDTIITKDRGSLSVDDRTNTIIMTDVQDKISRALIVKKQLDKPNLQVMIETRIVEVSDDFSRDIGVDWSGDVGVQPGDTNVGVGPSRGFDVLGGTYGYNWAVNYPSAAKSSIGFNFKRISGLTPFTLNAKLSAMESKGQVKILSSPKVLTLDNKEATIEQGLEYPINKLDANGNTITEFKTVALQLKVTPHITQDSRVSMVIETSKNDLGAVVNGQQSFQKKEAKTELLVNDGDTIVIGGIMKSRRDYSELAVPLFGKLPMMGWMFTQSKKTDGKEEMLIFITPKIITMDENSVISSNQ